MRLQRLLRMDAEEIGTRTLQELSKTFERLAAGIREVSLQPAPLRAQLDPAHCGEVLELYQEGQNEAAEAAMLARFEREAPARFFAGLAADSVPGLIHADYPEARAAVIAGADAVLQGRFGILGYGRLSFGQPVDWQLDPLSGKRAALSHWSRIPYLDESVVGDSKVVWELNRHQWLLELGQAWRFTGEERYARAAAELLQAWMEQNPPRQGINWTSALEVALRLISWCWALCLLRGSAALSPSLFARLLAWSAEQAAYVERYLSHYFSPNTHLTGEALGLFYVGCLLPELRGARRWRALGARLLCEQLERQVHDDGVYFEQSSRYQCYTVEFYLHLLLLAQRNGHELPPGLGCRVEAMLDVLLALRQPDGSLPQIGDSDGGWTVPLLRREARDCRNLFAIAAVLFQRGDYAWAAGEPGLEALWLLGPSTLCRFPAAVAPVDARPRFFRAGGYAVLRSGWREDAQHLVMDVGPIGALGHGHADLLSLQLAVFGEPCLVDAGTGCYPDSSPWRQYLRSSAAHNTLTVDGRGQAEPAGPFGWRTRPAAQLRHWQSGPRQTLIDADHAAFSSAEGELRHRRRVLFVDSRFFVVVDEVLGEGRHRVDLRWQFAPLELGVEPQGWLRARSPKGRALLLRLFSGGAVSTLKVCTGQQLPPAGWVSPDYGQVLPAPQAVYSLEAELPLRLVTLLWPLAEAGAAAPLIEVQQEAGLITELRGACGRIVIADHELGLRPAVPAVAPSREDSLSTRM